MSEEDNLQSSGCDKEEEESDDEQRHYETHEANLRQSREAMELAAEVVLQADKLDSATAPTVPPTIVEDKETAVPAKKDSDRSDASRSSEEPPISEIAVRDDTTERYYDDLDSSITPSVARGSRTMETHAREEHFLGRIAELLANIQQQGQSEAPSNQQTEQRLTQMAEMLENMQKQQYETLRYYEELSNKPKSKAEPDSPSPRNERSRNLSLLSTRRRKDPPCSPFSNRQTQSLRSPRIRGGNYPRPDPPAMKVLVEDVLEKLEPGGTLSTYEIDPNVRQERLTPPRSLRRVLEEADDEPENLDRKLPARDTSQNNAETSSKAVLTSTAKHARVRDVELNVWAPPGPLDITFSETTGPPTIGTIHRSSPMQESLEVGDVLVAVDGEDVRWMSCAMVSTILTCKNDSWRKLSVRKSVRAKYRTEVESLVRLLVPEESDNIDTMMDRVSGHEEDLISSLQTMRKLRARVESEEEQSTSRNSATYITLRSHREVRKERAARQSSANEYRTSQSSTSESTTDGQDADAKSQLQSGQTSERETVGREPPGSAPTEPGSALVVEPRQRQPVFPGAFRVGGIDGADDTTTVASGSVAPTMTASIHQQPIEATLVCSSDPDEPFEATLMSASDPEAELTRLREDLEIMREQQLQLASVIPREGGRRRLGSFLRRVVSGRRANKGER